MVGGLLMRPIPFEDESAGSILLRAASANRCGNIFQLLKGSNIVLNELSLIACLLDKRRFEHIVRKLGLDENAATLCAQRAGTSRRAARYHQGIAVPDNCYRRDPLSTFCPGCLDESEYWRQHWLLRPFSACTRHRCLLLTGCSRCGGRLSIGRPQLARCGDCLTQLSSLRAPPIGVNAQGHAEKWISNKDEKNVAMVLNFWTAFVEFDGAGDNPWDEHGRLELAILFATNREAAVASVARKVEFRRARVHPRIQLVSFLLGDTYLVDFANDVLAIIAKGAVRGSGDPHFKFLSKNAVAKITSVSMAQLADAIKLGLLPWPTVGGRAQRIATGEIEAALFRGCGILQQATNQGLKEELDTCSTTGALTSNVGAPAKVRPRGPRRGFCSPFPPPKLPLNGISFAATAEQLAVRERQVAKLVAHGLLRQMKQRGCELCISKKSLSDLQRELQRPDQLPLATAAELLGRNAVWLKGKWARCGIVRINHLHIWQFVSMVDLELVARLRTNWMSTAQTATALGIRFEHVQTAVSLQIIEAIPVEGRPGCFVYDRAAVLLLARTYGKYGVLKIVREMDDTSTG